MNKIYGYTVWVTVLTLILCLVAQTVENLPAIQETQIQSLGQEDPLEKGMATPSSILAQRIPWTEEAGGLHHADTTQLRD